MKIKQRDFSEPCIFFLFEGKVDLIFENLGKKTQTLIQTLNVSFYKKLWSL